MRTKCLLGDKIREDEMGWTSGTEEGRGKCRVLMGGDCKERIQLEDLGVDGGMILKHLT